MKGHYSRWEGKSGEGGQVARGEYEKPGSAETTYENTVRKSMFVLKFILSNKINAQARRTKVALPRTLS